MLFGALSDFKGLHFLDPSTFTFSLSSQVVKLETYDSVSAVSIESTCVHVVVPGSFPYLVMSSLCTESIVCLFESSLNTRNSCVDRGASVKQNSLATSR